MLGLLRVGDAMQVLNQTEPGTDLHTSVGTREMLDAR